jgi:hypothetical protein
MTFMSRSVFWVLLMAAALLAACKKQQPAAMETVTVDATGAPPSPRGGPGYAPAPDAGPPVVVADTGDVNATLARLTTELRRYVVSSRSVPKTFEEFATKARLEFPPAPAGKQYKISGQAVVLAKK